MGRALEGIKRREDGPMVVPKISELNIQQLLR